MQVGARPYKNVGRDRDPFSEIAFALRSLNVHAAQHGIRYIWILYDDKRHKPPHFIRHNDSVIRMVTHDEVLHGTPFEGRFHGLHVVLANLHHFKGQMVYFKSQCQVK
jgi:hypothetical protein